MPPPFASRAEALAWHAMQRPVATTSTPGVPPGICRNQRAFVDRMTPSTLGKRLHAEGRALAVAAAAAPKRSRIDAAFSKTIAAPSRTPVAVTPPPPPPLARRAGPPGRSGGGKDRVGPPPVKPHLQRGATMATYLGRCGYVVWRRDLDAALEAEIRAELRVVPESGMDVTGMGLGATAAGFDIFRESPSKFYLPHLYGVRKFGPPRQTKLAPGAAMSAAVAFAGKLFDTQQSMADAFLAQCSAGGGGGAKGLFLLHTGAGKTTLSLYLAAALGVKTMVVVNTTPLLEQWRDRIAQYLPSARVGLIQGGVFDVADRDVVLVMLKTLATRAFPTNAFDSFGLTIFDEAHHISAETFSNALFKVVTPYMLGLSASVDRKDNTRYVIEYFLGEVICEKKKTPDETMLVRSMWFESRDEDFLDVAKNVWGKCDYSTMVNKLCGYAPRTEFMLRVLSDHLCRATTPAEWTEARAHKKAMDAAVPVCACCGRQNGYVVRQTCCGREQYCLTCAKPMVGVEVVTTWSEAHQRDVTSRTKRRCRDCGKVCGIAQAYVPNPWIHPTEIVHTIAMASNLSLLEYMYDAIVSRNLCSVGMFVGGMKAAELAASIPNHVILATYNMCAEGFDVPSLTTEFLLTPKTDVLQISGRIPRVKHACTRPEIFDFVDPHSVFRNQWYKRRQFYTQHKFTITECRSGTYVSEKTKWRVKFRAAGAAASSGAAASAAVDLSDHEDEAEEEGDDEEDAGGEEDDGGAASKRPRTGGCSLTPHVPRREACIGGRRPPKTPN